MIAFNNLTGGWKIMNIAKPGIVSLAVGLGCDIINIFKYKQLQLMNYTLCEVLRRRKLLVFLRLNDIFKCFQLSTTPSRRAAYAKLTT